MEQMTALLWDGIWEQGDEDEDEVSTINGGVRICFD